MQHLQSMRTDTSAEVAKRADGAELFGGVGSLEPFMLETLGSRGTSALVKSQHLRDEILSKRSNIIPNLVAEAELTGKDLVKQLILSLGIERKVAAEKHVQDNTNGPDIAHIVIDTLLENLGCNVGRAAAASGHGTGHREVLGKTKVRNLHLKAIDAAEKKVLRLQITVSNAVRVQICSGRKNLLNDLAGIILGEGSTFYNLIVQFTTTDAVHTHTHNIVT